MSEMTTRKGISRRNFLKTSAVAAGAAVLGGAPVVGLAAAPTAQSAMSTETVVAASCRGNCNWGCSMACHVVDGVLTKVTPNPFPDPNYTGICLRGYSHVVRTYSNNRVKYPLKRAGERGSDQWERLSWDQAIAEISQKLSEIRDKWGGKAIVIDSQSGNNCQQNGMGTFTGRLGNAIGATFAYNMYDRGSTHGMFRILNMPDHGYGNETSSLLDAKMIVCWGTNPVYAEPHVWRFMQMAHDNGCKIVTFDPMKSATAHKADKWFRVNPGTDSVIALSMGNWVIQNGRVDETFMKTRTNAPFLVRRDNGEMMMDVEPHTSRTEANYYVIDSATGEPKLMAEVDAADVANVELEGSVEVDGVMCDTAFTLLKAQLAQYTFADAERISGVDAEELEAFTELWTTVGPVTINLMYSLDHYENGHLFFQAAAILQALTGNFAKAGAGFSGVFITTNPYNAGAVRTPSNPQPTGSIPSQGLYDVWRDQKFKGQDYPLKALITQGSNSMGNYADQARWLTDTLPNMECWVVLECEMTDCARYADYVLPAAYWFEVFDFRTIYNTHFAAIAEKAIEPLFESKPDYEIVCLLGTAMGYEKDFPLDRTDMEWAEMQFDSDWLREYGITLKSLREREHIQYIGGTDEHYVRGGKYAPLSTAHGRMMIYWEDPAPRYDFGQTFTDEEKRKERLPYFTTPHEAYPDNPLAKQYPLVFIQEHARFRTHTMFFDNELLRELDPEPMAKMGRKTAESRGIADGDIVEVFNDRGHAVCKAYIDDNMNDDLLSIPKGWQRNQFVAGCYQELTNSHIDPWGVGGTWFDALVEVRKWEGEVQ